MPAHFRPFLLDGLLLASLGGFTLRCSLHIIFPATVWTATPLLEMHLLVLVHKSGRKVQEVIFGFRLCFPKFCLF